MRWPGQRWRIAQALADWIFAREYMLGRRPDIDILLDRFADRLIARARAADCDELIVVGHSLGATMAVHMIARALERDPELARHGPAICLLTVGATIPKLALHPAASLLRDRIQRVAQAPGIAWTEYQARRDPISFYKFDPVTLRPFEANAPGRKPRIVLVGLKDMLTDDSYQRHKLNHMRLHYQFVMGNEQRAIYDYFMLIGGPAPFAFLSECPQGALEVFAADGAYQFRPAGEGHP
jgi:pimeloyl-ACP methyl ester carboxylesterase